MTLAQVIAIILAFGAGLAWLAIQRRSVTAAKIARGLLVSYVTIALILVLGELYFRYFHADTEGRLASNNWMARYWAVNSWGYRDREWTPADYADKTRVAVVGDSFTAGWGLENPAERFSDVLANALGDDYAVFNLGVPGSSTQEQLETLQAFPALPVDAVVLQYFLNDIDYTALRLGLDTISSNMTPITRESYLANFIFSRFDTGFGAEYWELAYSRYDNFAVWELHAEELNAFAQYVDDMGARLIVVIFPNMQDPVRSIPYVDRVAQVFEARGNVDVIKLFDAVAAWNPQTVTVSARDAHPSVEFHRYVGELLYEQYFATQQP